MANSFDDSMLRREFFGEDAPAAQDPVEALVQDPNQCWAMLVNGFVNYPARHRPAKQEECRKAD